MAELYLGRPLFPGTSEADQLTRIVTVLGTPTGSEWPEGQRLASQKGVSFPSSQHNTLRQQFSSANRHDMSTEAFNLLDQMFKYNSDHRMTAA